MEPIAGNWGVMASGSRTEVRKGPATMSLVVCCGQWRVLEIRYRCRHRRETPIAIVSKGRSGMAIQRASPRRSWGSRFSSR